MAAKKKSAKAPPERGAALVERVIAKLARSKKFAPKPLASDVIAKLAFPGKKPLPPSLKRWLAFDARYLRIFDVAKPKLARTTFHDMMEREFDAQTAEAYDFSSLLPGDCYALPGGSDSRPFLYVGEADDAGEYPVLVVDTDDTPFVCVEYPGLDVYLAVTFEVVRPGGRDHYARLFDDAVWKSAMETQARKNFYGFKSFDVGGGDIEHVDGKEAAIAAADEVFAKL